MPPQRVIGVDLGGTSVRAGAVERDGTVVRRLERPTPLRSEEELLTALDESVEELVGDDIVAVGFGIPSTLDRGRVVGSVNVPLHDVDLAERMRERFRVPVGVDNDANAATIAEWRLGAGRGADDVVMLTLGTGVGGGLILARRPYRGAVGSAAELGHMVVVHDGLPCAGACTGRGHLEAYVSGRAAAVAATERLGEETDPPRLLTLAESGNAAAREVLHAMGRYLGSALGSLVNAFNPEVVIVGGGFGSAAGEHLLAPAREVLAREGLRPGRDLVRVVGAGLGPTAGVVGAALIGFEALDGAPAA